MRKELKLKIIYIESMKDKEKQKLRKKNRKGKKHPKDERENQKNKKKQNKFVRISIMMFSNIYFVQDREKKMKIEIKFLTDRQTDRQTDR